MCKHLTSAGTGLFEAKESCATLLVSGIRPAELSRTLPRTWQRSSCESECCSDCGGPWRADGFLFFWAGRSGCSFVER